MQARKRRLERSISMTTKIDLCRFSRLGRALLLSHGTIVCILIFMSQSGCAEYISRAKSYGPSYMADDRIDVSRISEIIVGEITREQIEAMFGVPGKTLRTSNSELLKEIYTKNYVYFISPYDPRADSLRGVIAVSGTKCLLYVKFKDDVVIMFKGPVPGAVELLKQMSD